MSFARSWQPTVADQVDTYSARTVCTLHLKFVPCRPCFNLPLDEREDAWTSDPMSVEIVRLHQMATLNERDARRLLELAAARAEPASGWAKTAERRMSQINELERVVRTRNATISELARQRDQFMANIEDYRATIEMLRSRIRELEDGGPTRELGDALDAIDTLRRRVADLEHAQEVRVAALREAQNERDLKQRGLDRSEEKVDELVAEVDRLEAELSEERRNYGRMEDIAAFNKRKADELQERLERMDASRFTNQALLRELERRMTNGN